MDTSKVNNVLIIDTKMQIKLPNGLLIMLIHEAKYSGSILFSS